MAINDLTTAEAANVAIGGVGNLLEEGNDAITGKKIVAIQFLEDTAFTALLPSSSKWIGTTGQSGDTVAGNTFPTGLTIFGQWTGFTLASGSVIAYEGNF